VLEQELDDRFPGRVVVGVQAERLEVLVLADQLGRLDGQQIQKPFQIGPREWVFQVLDDIELDAAVAQNFQRAPRLASARVVVEGELVHHSFLRVIRSAVG